MANPMPPGGSVTSTAICQLCSGRADAEIPVAGMGAHFRLFHPDTGITEETIARAKIVDEPGREAAPFTGQEGGHAGMRPGLAPDPEQVCACGIARRLHFADGTIKPTPWSDESCDGFTPAGGEETP